MYDSTPRNPPAFFILFLAWSGGNGCENIKIRLDVILKNISLNTLDFYPSLCCARDERYERGNCGVDTRDNFSLARPSRTAVVIQNYQKERRKNSGVKWFTWWQSRWRFVDHCNETFQFSLQHFNGVVCVRILKQVTHDNTSDYKPSSCRTSCLKIARHSISYLDFLFAFLLFPSVFPSCFFLNLFRFLWASNSPF